MTKVASRRLRRENPNRASADVSSDSVHAQFDGVSFEDQRPESVAQTKLQELVNGSNQVKQLTAYQKMADSERTNKPSLQYLTHSVPNSSPLPVAQLVHFTENREMDEGYQGEHKKKGRRSGLSYEKYHTKKQQLSTLAFFDNAKDLAWHQGGEKVTVTASEYVMSGTGEIHIKREGETAHHSALLAGGNVAVAGHIDVDHGTITEINNDSGHYKPDIDNLLQVMHMIMKRANDASKRCLVTEKKSSKMIGNLGQYWELKGGKEKYEVNKTYNVWKAHAANRDESDIELALANEGIGVQVRPTWDEEGLDKQGRYYPLDREQGPVTERDVRKALKAQLGEPTELYESIEADTQVKTGPCFITTACIEAMGLPDDCEELTVLREFRDNYLLQKRDGQQLIEFYYTYSPQIVAAIRRREDEQEIWKRIYITIKKCVEAVKGGDNEFAFQMYCNKVMELKEEFIRECSIPDITISKTDALKVIP